MKNKMKKMIGTTIVIAMTTLMGCTNMVSSDAYASSSEQAETTDEYEVISENIEEDSMIGTDTANSEEDLNEIDFPVDNEKETDIEEVTFESYEAVVNHTANVREGIGVDTNRIDTVEAGVIVTVLEELEDWCRILFEEQEVYIMAQYLSEATEENIAEIAQQIEDAEKEIATVAANNTEVNVINVPEENNANEESEQIVNENNSESTPPTPIVDEVVNAGVQNGTNNNTNTQPSGNNNSNAGTTNAPVATPQYTCEARVLNSNSIYNNCNVVIYIKTDHPDGSKLSISTNSGPWTSIVGIYYSDINYIDKDMFYTQMERVEGGYVCIVQPKGTGNYTFSIKDTTDPYHPVVIGSIDILVSDRTVAENAFYQNVINTVTTPEMTDKEKMDAICEYVRNNFVYMASDTDGKAIFLTVHEGLWVDVRRIHCISATSLMQEFANRLGLQSDSTYAGYLNHYYATITIDGIPYIYDACPLGETGVVSNWNYVL